MEFDGTEYNEKVFSRSQERRIAVQKGTVIPERLAEIIFNSTEKAMKEDKALTFFNWKRLTFGIAAELLKTLDIREKE